jgi:TetR/AcrR family transcriptional regulator
MRASKKGRILHAALAEFAENGFSLASTNTVAEVADVAKGLVFHHFGDKEALFLAVAERAVDHVEPRFRSALANAPPDPFARALVWIETSLALTREDPVHARFFLVALPDAPPNLRREVHARIESRVSLGQLAAGVDESRLREGVTVDDAVGAIRLMALGLKAHFTPALETRSKARAFDVGTAASYAERMLTRLRDGIYRDG